MVPAVVWRQTFGQVAGHAHQQKPLGRQPRESTQEFGVVDIWQMPRLIKLKPKAALDSSTNTKRIRYCPQQGKQTDN